MNSDNRKKRTRSLVLISSVLFISSCTPAQIQQLAQTLETARSPSPQNLETPSIQVQKLEVVEMTVTPPVLTIEKGQSQKLTVQVKLKEGKTAAVKASKVDWKSKNEAIATVQEGVVTAKEIGKTTITAKIFSLTQDIAVEVVPVMAKPATPTPTPGTGESLFAPTPTPTPLPTDSRPPLERIASIKFTKAAHPIGLKVTPVYLSEAGEPIDWQWEGTVRVTYTIQDRQRNWDLTTDARASLTKDKSFFIAEGDFDSVHEILIKEEVNITYTLTLPNGKVFSAKRQPIEGATPPATPTPTPTPQPS